MRSERKGVYGFVEGKELPPAPIGERERLMRHDKQIRAAVRSMRSEPGAAVVAPPPSARPTGLEMSRAGLLGILAREPAVCRSVGLVR